MVKFLLTLLIITSSGDVRVAVQEHETVHDCADAGIAFVSQDPAALDGARIAFVCEPVKRGSPA